MDDLREEDVLQTEALKKALNKPEPAAKRTLPTGEMRALLRDELTDLTRQLTRLESLLENATEETPVQRRARARASLLAILDRLA